MTTFTQDQWIILALVFILGLLVGMFLTAGGRKKWKTRYRDEVTRRETLEREHRDREKHWTTREKEWSKQDSARVSSRGRTDTDRDGVPDRRDDRPLDDRTA